MARRRAAHRAAARLRRRWRLGRGRRGAQARDGAPVRHRGARRSRRDARTARPSATSASASASTRAPPASPRPPPTPEAEARCSSASRKLLALAESPNVTRGGGGDERRAAPDAQAQPRRHSRARAYSFRHLGAPTGRVSEAERILATILGEHFFVECIWVPVYRPREGKRGSVLEVCGTPSNLEMAEYVHAFLSHTAERLWRSTRASRASRNRDRRTYLAGVMTGFREKLDAQRRAPASAGPRLGGRRRPRQILAPPPPARPLHAATPGSRAQRGARPRPRRRPHHRPCAGGPRTGLPWPPPDRPELTLQASCRPGIATAPRRPPDRGPCSILPITLRVPGAQNLRANGGLLRVQFALM